VTSNIFCDVTLADFILMNQLVRDPDSSRCCGFKVMDLTLQLVSAEVLLGQLTCLVNDES
jgi:hypothetical protein